MDSRVVSRRIKAKVWPVLRERGFSRFTERSAWRDVDDIIHVVYFQSFNSYNAEVTGVTTYSFSVRLGAYFSQIPSLYGESSVPRKGLPKPPEYECHLRSSLVRSFAQPELDRRDIWYIDPDQRYLGRAVDDVISQLAFADNEWFKRYSDLGETLALLLGPSLDDPEGPAWGFGNPGSPMRNYQTGYIARALGNKELACQFLTRAASHFRTNSRLATDVEECGANA